MKNAPIYIADDRKLKTGTQYIYPEEYEGDLQGVLITNDEILARVESLAECIASKYKSKSLVMVCVLKGSSTFFHYLMTALMKKRQKFRIEFIKVSSYEGTSSTGNLTISENPSSSLFKALHNQNVIIVEDIIDTGLTLTVLLRKLKDEFRPRVIEVCSLLHKRLGDKSMDERITAEYTGFSIPDKFVVGSGLDYNQAYRDLLDIWIISEQGIASGEKKDCV